MEVYVNSSEQCAQLWSDCYSTTCLHVFGLCLFDNSIATTHFLTLTESEAEERQNLLSGEGGEGEEQPPSHPPPPPVLPPPILPPPHETYHPPKYNEPPPAYVTAILPQYHGYPAAPGMGVPVEIQVEGGQMVPGTLVQEVSMLYLCSCL